jgi:hypothetical protein
VLALWVVLLVGATPEEDKPAARAPHGFAIRLSAGAFLGSGWATESYRDQLSQLQRQGFTFWQKGTEPEAGLLARTLPVAGPLLTLDYGGKLADSERAELLLTSALQGVGLALFSYQAYMRNEPPEPPVALELSISPLVAGRLGLCLTLLF